MELPCSSAYTNIQETWSQCRACAQSPKLVQAKKLQIFVKGVPVRSNIKFDLKILRIALLAKTAGAVFSYLDTLLVCDGRTLIATICKYTTAYSVTDSHKYSATSQLIGNREFSDNEYNRVLLMLQPVSREVTEGER